MSHWPEPVMPADESQRYRVTLRELEVVAVHDLSPGMRRLTLGGVQLGPRIGAGGLIPGFDSFGPDDHVKLFFPDPETGLTSLPIQDGRHIRWPDNPPAISRDYTPRGYVAGSGQLNIDFVMHGNGVGDAWAARAQPGMRIYIAGPRTSMMIPRAGVYLLIGDETALPAIANWLEMLPADAQVTAHVLVRDPSAMPDLHARHAKDVHWHCCDPTCADAMVKLVRNSDVGPETYVWAGGERAAIDALRGYLDKLDLDPGMIDLAAYWILGESQPL